MHVLATSLGDLLMAGQLALSVASCSVLRDRMAREEDSLFPEHTKRFAFDKKAGAQNCVPTPRTLLELAAEMVDVWDAILDLQTLVPGLRCACMTGGQIGFAWLRVGLHAWGWCGVTYAVAWQHWW
eukprot:scaffold236876_cov23-Tisochrysis_lutea.AAC.1